MKKIQLVGAQRYHFGGELFLSGEVYLIADEKRADKLLDATDSQTGFPYFEEYKGDKEGVKPTAPVETTKVARRERPQRGVRPERPARRASQPVNEIEDADAVEV